MLYLRIAYAQGLDEFCFLRVEIGSDGNLLYQRRIEVEVQMPHLSPPLQVLRAGRPHGQHDDAAEAQVSLSSPNCFLEVERITKIDDEHVAWDSGRTEVVLGMMDLGRIDAASTPVTAREQDVLQRHVGSFAGRRLNLAAHLPSGESLSKTVTLTSF